MEIQIVKKAIPKEKLLEMAKSQFGDLVKAVVDVKQEIMAVGGELHADGEVLLMEEHGSKREDTWGINLYPEKSEDEWIEFGSMINIKPSFGNRSRSVEDANIQTKIRQIVGKLVTM